MKFLLAGCAALIFAACSGNESPAAKTPEIPVASPTASTPSATATTSLLASPTAAPPTATPAPLPAGCNRLRDLPGMPVALGIDGATNGFCVTWVPGAASVGYTISIAPSQAPQLPATALTLEAGAGAKSVLLPAGYLPPLRANGMRCFSTAVAFDIVVKTSDEAYVGGEDWLSECSPIARTASGCPGPFIANSGSSIGRAEWLEGQPTCITWVDAYSGETGFAIHLTYSPSNDTFDFVAPPNTIELILPPEAQQTFPGPHKDPQWTVDVLLDGGKREHVGGGAIIVM